MLHDDNGREERYQFASLADLARYLDKTPRTWGRINQAKANTASMGWDLNTGYDLAWELARYGWQDGARKVRAALKQLPPSTPMPVNVNDFYGHMPHVPRFCAGAPDSMVRHSKRANTGQGRVLSLIVPINALAIVTAQYMSNFGTGLAHYIAGLETQGTRVEVIGAFTSRMEAAKHGYKRLSYAWGIKAADQPLDLPVLAFAIGHPAMFRRIGFALYERSSCAPSVHYGQTVPSSRKDIIRCPVGAYVLNGMAKANEIARTPEAAYEYITKQLAEVLKDREAA